MKMNKTTIIGIGALLVAALGFGGVMLASQKIGQNLVYYWSPGELIKNGEQAYGPTIRLGGVVRAGTLQWDKDKTHLTFMVADSHKFDSPAVMVVSTELPPQMFREGIGVVVEGTYDRSGIFTSNRLMVNHSNEYKAPHPVDGVEQQPDWKQSVSGAEPQANARPQ